MYEGELWQVTLIMKRENMINKKPGYLDREQEDQHSQGQWSDSECRSPSPNMRRSSRNAIMACLPKAAALLSAYPIAPISPGRDIKRPGDYSARARRSFSGRGYSGPMISIIPKEAREKKRDSEFESREPTSPKVSCIGQVKLKKHMCKAKVKAKDRSWDRPVLRIKEIKSELSSPRGIKALQLKKFFSFSREKKPEQTVSDSEFAPEAGVPSLGQLKRFSCRRDKGASLANIFQDSVQDDFKCSPTNKSEESSDEDKGDVRKFASDDQELESPKNEDEDQKLESPKNENEDRKLENPQNEDEDWNLENPGNEDEDWNLENPKPVLISHSAPLLSEPLPKPAATNGQPSEINLWKRRSVAAPWALDLKRSYLLEMRGPATL